MILITLSDYVICFESVMFDPNAVIHASVVEIRMKFKILKLNSASITSKVNYTIQRLVNTTTSSR